jgi:curved DNA-binding protein CbpA
MRIGEALRVLGLEAGSSQKQVSSAYRKSALVVHPDKNPNNRAAAAQFLKINRVFLKIMSNILFARKILIYL